MDSGQAVWRLLTCLPLACLHASNTLLLTSSCIHPPCSGLHHLAALHAPYKYTPTDQLLCPTPPSFSVDRIIFLHEGRVVWEGAVEDFDTTGKHPSHAIVLVQ